MWKECLNLGGFGNGLGPWPWGAEALDPKNQTLPTLGAYSCQFRSFMLLSDALALMQHCLISVLLTLSYCRTNAFQWHFLTYTLETVYAMPTSLKACVT